MKYRTILQLVTILLVLASSVFAQVGTMTGKVVDNDNQQALPGVNVILQGTELGAATDPNGNFLIRKVPVGPYSVLFSFIGFEKKILTDVFVKSNKNTHLSVKLAWKVIAGEEISVMAGYFEQPEDRPVSIQTLSYEEIRRSPGAREDVSRMIQNLPGVNPTSDDRNDLVVRGGSPSEVLFRIDHFDIPNPNHFGTQGATGGPISMINTEFVDNLKFMAGGFTAPYGHKLSGAMDVQFREGNREGYNSKIDLNFGGVGGYFEGPLQSAKGSFLIGAHRSFLDFLESMLNTGGVPIYSNLQGKVIYDFNPDHQFELLGVGGDDRIEFDDEFDIDDFKIGEPDTVDYGHVVFKSRQFTLGTSLRSFWSKNFYTIFSLSQAYNSFFTDYNDKKTVGLHQSSNSDLSNKKIILESDTYDNSSVEQQSTIKLDGTWILDNHNTLSFGTYFRLLKFDHEIELQINNPDDRDQYGQLSKAFQVNYHQNLTPKVGSYLNYKFRFLKNFIFNIGGRYDYFDLLTEGNFSPRISLLFEPNNLFSCHLGGGSYFQNPEFLHITGHESNQENLTNIQADHYIAGFNYLLTANTRFTCEGYYKQYSNYPVLADAGYEMISMANSGDQYGNAGSGELLSVGKGWVKGIEFMLHKKLADQLYGLLSYTYAKIRHQALDGILRRGAFDNRHVFNIVVGYRVNKSWEFSLKWRYAGGVPYTPFDEQASIASGDSRLDLTQINNERFEPYHRLDLRFDHRTFYKKITLISYFSIENVYNRQNQHSIYWNKTQAATSFRYQTGFFPVGGFSLEF